MKIDLGAVINDPSISPDMQIEINFTELLKNIFNTEDKKERKPIFFNNLTYLN